MSVQRKLTTLLKKFSVFRPLLVAAVMCATIAPVQAQQPLRIGTFGPLNNESIAVAIAINNGLYKEAGLDPELVVFKGGAPAVQALAAKAIDVCICSPEHVIRLTTRGLPAHVVVPLSDVTSYVLFGPKDSPAKNIADLKGKKIGITSPGSKTDDLVRLALIRAGLNPNKDAEIVGIGSSFNNLAGIQGKRIDAGMISGLDVLTAEHDQLAVVYDWRTTKTASLALIGLDSWTKSQPEKLKGVITATLKAANLAVHNKDERVKALARLYPNVSADLINQGAERLIGTTVTAPRFTPVEFKHLQDDTIAMDSTLKPLTYDEFNPDFLKN